MAGGFEFDFEAPDLRRLLEHIKSFDPKLATDLRRELRRSGDEVIADQRAILNGPKPGGVSKTGTTLRLVRPKNGRAPYFAKRNVYRLGADSDGGVSDLRAKIAAGLRTQVSTAGKKQSVSIKTTGPRSRTAGGAYNMARVWQARLFRHPVFGNRERWVYQQGRPYFWDPIDKHYVSVRQRIFDVIADALERIAERE